MSNWKGKLGEWKVGLRLGLSLNKSIYHRFNNLIVPSKNGTTQIDHLIVSKFGLFIIETKNKGGWIFGGEDNATWTQTFRGSKFTFQNPLRQLFRQRKVLSEFLIVHESLIFPIVYFAGDCELKTEMPKNVLTSGLPSYIKSFKEPIIHLEQVNRIVGKLKHHKKTSDLTLADHIESLHKRHSSMSTCPKCGSALVVRVKKSGPYFGVEFMGCARFPQCRFTKAA